MDILIKSAIICDPESKYHNQQVDIKIQNGIISEIASSISAPDLKQLKLDDLHVSRGWMDSSVSLGEPGFEERETIKNGLKVAAQSGFTHVAIQPNNHPIADSQSHISLIKQKATGCATTAMPIGALTMQSKGVDLAELFDMQSAGAIGFGDYKKTIPNANLLKIGLQYVQDFNGLILAYAEDRTIKGNGVAHEGIVSTRLGLKGIPALAEEVDLARNLFLLEYTGGKLHVPTISSKGSVALIRQAKAKKLRVNCSVAVHNLVLTDETLENFDTRYKVTPPLRDETHRKALIEGVLDGTIDCITSDHNPLDIEHKKLEFDNATSGTIGLETAFGALQNTLPLNIIIEKLTNAKAIFGVENAPIESGQKACLTLFDPNTKSVFTKDMINSRSKNSAFLNMELKGRVYGIINNNTLLIDETTN